MKYQLIARLKTLLRPITSQRFRLERAKYAGVEILEPQAGNDFIARSLASGQPAAIGKMGSVELGAVVHYERHKDAHGRCARWGKHATLLHRNAGVYPPDPATFARFCQVFAESLGALDGLGVWFRPGEFRTRARFAPQSKPLRLTSLEPYYHQRPWSGLLRGKRVLIASPFAETIARQGPRLSQVWRAKPDMMSDLDLLTLKVPLSAGLTAPVYPDWFTALDAMTDQMAAQPFDVAIVGAGAWSIPLIARAKRMGKWAIHLGGPAQVLFGVKGARWDQHGVISPLENEAWVRPGEQERPATFQQVENGCYW